MNDTPVPEPRVLSPRNTWINALRNEQLRVRDRDMATVVGVGVWIASYADADGGSAFPSTETLSVLEGISKESVTRAVKVLVAVGMLTRRRRPNTTAVYQLLMPTSQPDWAAHMHLFADTRQRRDYAKKKAAAAAALIDTESRTASTDAIRTASVAGFPDSVRGGVSGPPAEGPDSVRGRPRTASVDAVRTASVAGGTCTDLPTVGTPTHDTTWFGLGAQPPVARESPLRIVSTSRGSADTGSSQPPLLMSAPTEQLPEPDTPPAEQPATGLAEARRVRAQLIPPHARTDTA